MTAKTPANAKPDEAMTPQQLVDLRVMQNDIRHLDRVLYAMLYAVITGFILLLGVHAGTLLWVDSKFDKADAKLVQLEARVDDRLDHQYELLLQILQQLQQQAPRPQPTPPPTQRPSAPTPQDPPTRDSGVGTGGQAKRADPDQ